jgi:hypothetical protein
MAQMGSRLVDAAAAKMAEDFFSAFEARLRPASPVAAEAATGAGVPVPAPSPAWRSAWLLRFGVGLIALGVIYLVFASTR